MSTEVFTLIATLSGVAVGSLGSVVVTILNNRSAERRHRREVALRAAADYYSAVLNQSDAQPGLMEPFTDTVVGLLLLMDKLSITSNKDTLLRTLQEHNDIMESVFEWRTSVCPNTTSPPRSHTQVTTEQ